jgi:MoaA/NifB/PqqE/SkfB family radical SAM enzyme
VDWWITSRCNLACDFCYGPEPGNDPGWLRDEILAAIRASSARAVTFCGGEPLLVRDVGKYARQLRDAGKVTILNTNGALLRRRVGQGLDFAFDVVGLSLDGSRAEVHRAMRGAKADFDEVIRAASLVRGEPGMSLKLATVVSRVNRDDLPSLAALVRTLQPDVWRMYQYSARGAVNVGHDRHAISEADFASLASAAACLAAPVPAAPAPESVTAGCLIIDPQGNVLQPLSDGYQRLGNCLEQPVDLIWAHATFTSTVIQNKRWLASLPL